MEAPAPSSRWVLARTLRRLSSHLSLEPMAMGALAREYANVIEDEGLDMQPMPPAPLARLCQGAGVTTIHHGGKTCVTWTKQTKAFVSETLEAASQAKQPSKTAEAEPDDVAAVEGATSDKAVLGADVDFFAAFRARTTACGEWTMFTRDRRRSGADTAYVRKGSIVITPSAAASVGLAKGSKVVLFSGLTGRIKVQIDADSPHALTVTGDGSTSTLKVSAHAFVRDHKLILGRYRLEPIGDGAAILTLVEAATPAA